MLKSIINGATTTPTQLAKEIVFITVSTLSSHCRQFQALPE